MPSKIIDAQSQRSNEEPFSQEFHMTSPARTPNPLALAISSLLLAVSTPSQAAPAANSAYNTDKTHVFVNEQSGKVFDNINSILCQISQTRYSEAGLINQDWQRVLIDVSQCESRDSTDNASASSGSGSSSASGAQNYNTWVVKSERLLDPSSPQVLSAFVHAEGDHGGPPKTIQAKMLVTEAASDSNPTGLFTMNFKASVNGQPAMKGIMKAERNSAGQVVIKWAEQAITGSASKAALIKSTTSGQGSVYLKETSNQGPQGGSQESRFNFKYDENYFSRVNPNSNDAQCLSRTQYETSAWRYGLYDPNTGDRTSINGGFPINTTSDNKGSFGYLGYYGLQLPPGASSLTTGDEVYRNQFINGQQSSERYTLQIKGGKLKKHSRKILTLDDIKNIPVEGAIFTAGSQPQPGAPMPFYRLTWDGSQLAIREQATVTPGQPPSWSDIPDIPIQDKDNLAQPDLTFYSQGLGGDVRIKLDCAAGSGSPPGFQCSAPNGSTPVYVFELSTITNPDQLDLYCYNNCPNTTPTGLAANPNHEFSFPPTQYHYTFSDLLLKEGTNPVTLTSNTNNNQSFGYNSGPLIRLQDIAALACPFDPTKICGNQAFELEEFYTWETGSNSYNKLTLALDKTGTPVPFDPPIAINFTYPQGGTSGINPSSTDNRYAGAKFFLQYGGFGDLQGIPGKCSNPANPSDTDSDCSKPGRRWVPEFTIPANTIVSSGTSQYLVKPLEIEQRMSGVDQSSCANLQPTDLSGQWPDLAKDWVDPDLGSEPTLTTPPKVIAGVIQE